MALPYRCLIMDHDDTVVRSTPEIHYPAHVETLRQIRPEARPVSLDEWYRLNFHPGIMHYFEEDLMMNPAELKEEFRIWREFTSTRIPDFFPGMLELLQEFRKQGGIVTVVSHSEVDLIERDYLHASENAGIGPFVPDRIFGWTYDETKRKPHPYPANQIMDEFKLEPLDILLVDDLRPGVEMAKTAGIDAAAAGWAHNIEEIRSYMNANCRYSFDTVEEFGRFILS